MHYFVDINILQNCRYIGLSLCLIDILNTPRVFDMPNYYLYNISSLWIFWKIVDILNTPFYDCLVHMFFPITAAKMCQMFCKRCNNFLKEKYFFLQSLAFWRNWRPLRNNDFSEDELSSSSHDVLSFSLKVDSSGWWRRRSVSFLPWSLSIEWLGRSKP